MADYSQLITRDPQTCGGEPVLTGTRVTLRTVLASLASGDSVQEILKDFPSLKPDDVLAAIAYAPARSAEALQELDHRRGKASKNSVQD